MDTANPAPTEFAIAQIVQARQAIKDARTIKRHAWEQEDEALERDQQLLDTVLLDQLNKIGASSVSTSHGTVIRSLKTRPAAVDWGAIWEWQKANDAADLVERRLKTKFITDYMEEHGGALPPGITVHREYEVSVRRPTKQTPPGGPAESEE